MTSPSFIQRQLEALKFAVPHKDSHPRLDLRTFIVTLSLAVFIALLWYYGRLGFYREHVAPTFFKDAPIEKSELYGYFYLALSSILSRMVLPMIFIVLVFKDKPSNYGYRIRGTWKLGKIYLGLLAFMLPLLFYASSQPVFQKKYPLYDYAHSSLSLLIVYELSYILVFLSGESFWRGFVVFGLAKRFGLYGILVMAIPYAMIHFGKPFPEALGAIAAGSVLGYIALKHKSFWLGVALHSSIGISMDLLSLWRKGQLGPLLGLE